MEEELISIQRPTNRQPTDEANIPNSSKKTNPTNDALEKVELSSISKKKLFPCMKNSSAGFLLSSLFTGSIIIIGTLIVYFAAPRPSTKCERSFKVTMTSSISSNPSPECVTTGDVNNDHKMDIIVVNSGTNTIGIFVSKGDGTFRDEQTFSTGSQSNPRCVVVTDFNNDNYQDIAVANYGTNSIGIFLGKGNATFADQKLFSVGSSHPLFVSVSDFNNDNQTDIAVVNFGTNSIGILLGNGDGSFHNQISYSTGYDSIPYSLVVADFNNDRILDIAVANYGTNNIGIFLGSANGLFTSQITYATFSKSNPSSIAVGDFNNDKHLDIVVTNSGTGNVGIFLGHGNGTFLPQTIYQISSNAYPQQITVGYFNQDNNLDIVVVDSKNDQVHIINGTGDGTFGLIATYDTTSGSSPYWVAIADFNNDNQSDIVVANYATNEVLPLINYSVLPSARLVNYPFGTPSITAAVVVSDFNNDHILDIASNTYNSIMILIGLGDGTFGAVATFPVGIQSNVQYMAAADLNNDNRTDIVISDIGYNDVGVFLGNGDGTFAAIKTYDTGTGSTPYWTTLIDINNDSYIDIVSANEGTDSLGLFIGKGDGTFASMINYYLGSGSAPTSVAIGDINNDNYLDIVVSSLNGYIIVLLGRGNATFIIWTAYITGANFGTLSIVLADFNSDHCLDIAAANSQAFNISILLGYGNGSFMEQTFYSTGSGSQPFYMIIADFNNDNISDIATNDYANDEIVILYGYGNGEFVLGRIYSTGLGSKPYGIAAADLDNDTNLEFVAGLFGSGSIGVLTPYYAAQFIINSTYSTGSIVHPYSVAVGDLNNDNKPDIVVANSGSGTLGILFGLGNNTFSTEMVYLIGSDYYPRYVIVTDINQDNKLDIVSVNSKMDCISIIIGYGNGTFAEQMIVSTGGGSNPYAVVSGDFNNDKWLDLAIANEGTDSIGILYRFNYTEFQTQGYYYNLESRGPIGIVVSDLNNDSYLDIATTFYSTNNIGIVLGYGNGNFTNMITYPIPNNAYPWGIAVGDFNNDGLLDIVVTNTGTNNIVILFGYSNGNFTNMMTYSTGNSSSPISVVVNDLNDDGKLDIVVANQGSNSVGILLGYGNGTFSVVETYSTGVGSMPNSVTVGDFNNDGRIDIAVANYGNDNVGILLGYGTGTFQDQYIFSTGFFSRPVWVTVGDFNRDGRLDIATANYNDNDVGVLIGYGNGSFMSVIGYSTGIGSLPRCIKVGDFNSDNISDIAVVTSGTNTLFVLFGYGDGSFLYGLSQSTGPQSQPYGLAIGDFNNDNRLDVAIANNLGSYVLVYLAYSSQPFGGLTPYYSGDGSSPYSIGASDLNKDGWLDIIVANYGTNNIGVLLGGSHLIFLPMITYSTGINSGPYSIGVADFNNDHQLDIVATNSNTDNIIIFFGYGNGTFTIGQTYSTGTSSRPYTVTIGDFNNDKNSDIAVANSGTSNVFLLYGNGNGTFTNNTLYPLGYEYQPYSIVAKDLNQDNWTDIAIACYGTVSAETLIQTC